jgi:hypothetical protein
MQVFLLAKSFKQQLVEPGEQVPIDVANVVAERLLPMI